MAAMGISVLGFCSCSDNDAPGIDSSVSASNAIRFAANTELASRAGDITTNTLKDFYVYAYTRTDGVPELFMDNVTVSKSDNNTWTYSPIKYWPADQTVDFYAFAPAWVGESGPLKPVPYYNYPGDEDIVYAVSPDLTGNTDAPNAQVVFNFRHALSKVTVKMSSTNENLKVKVTNVVLTNIMSRGNFNFPKVSTSQTIPSETTTPGAVSENSIGKWTDQNTRTGYILHMSQDQGEIIELTSTPIDITLHGDGIGSQYMMPQPLVWRSNGSGNDTYITVMGSIYDVKTGDKLWPNENTPPENISEGSTNRDGLMKFPLSTSKLTNWIPGCHYIYNMVINANEEMGAIEFGSPTVDSFVEIESNYQ